MTASKDANNMNRPAPPAPHRLSVGSASTHPRPRTHSHSLSVGSINSSHRVTRRKSMSSSTTAAASNLAAVAAVAREASAMEASASGGAAKRGAKANKSPAFPASLPTTSGFAQAAFQSNAVADGLPLSSLPEVEKGAKSRARRASEGSRLGKGEGKRSSGGELRCEKCGKAYKHSSCLTKHLWEHTPEWAYTSKLLISKHQQVQLLEAASVLVAMNQESAEESETSSPAASGSSEPHNFVSSAETTPPPHPDDPSNAFNLTASEAKRISANSSVYSQSYQSSVFSESAPLSSRPYISHYRQWSSDNRPTTSGTSVAGSYTDEDQADLAAAVGLLSCSYGTPKSGPIMLPADVPPVPPLPAQFAGHRAEVSSGINIDAPGQSRGYNSFVRRTRDVEMEEDDDYDRNAVLRVQPSYEEEEGMFGKMEE